MKKFLFAIFAMAITLTACGQNNNRNTKDDMKTLVAYFSATGTTEAVAKDLAAVTGGTLYEIKPEVKYTAEDLDWTVKTSRSSIDKANAEFKAQYPEINWRAGKTLNRASKSDIKAWVDSLR